MSGNPAVASHQIGDDLADLSGRACAREGGLDQTGTPGYLFPALARDLVA
jgi:hypothetical protein